VCPDRAPSIGLRAAHQLIGHKERVRTAFDFRPPAFIPLYRGIAWLMAVIIQRDLQDCTVSRRR
jgi:hypothetical protein